MYGEASYLPNLCVDICMNPFQIFVMYLINSRLFKSLELTNHLETRNLKRNFDLRATI